MKNVKLFASNTAIEIIQNKSFCLVSLYIVLNLKLI
jgi:hypothetical protein